MGLLEYLLMRGLNGRQKVLNEAERWGSFNSIFLPGRERGQEQGRTKKHKNRRKIISFT